MSWHPPIPVQFRISGSKALGMTYKGKGREKLRFLMGDMRRGNLPEAYGEEHKEALEYGKAGPFFYSSPNGDHVEINVEIFPGGVNRCFIKATPGVPTGGKPKPMQLLALRCMVFGIIENVYTETLPTDSAKWMYRTRYDISYYDFETQEYVILSGYNIYSAGCEIYEEGQSVILGPQPDIEFPPVCCSDDRQLSDALLENPSTKINFGYLDVYPVNITGWMTKLIG